MAQCLRGNMAMQNVEYIPVPPVESSENLAITQLKLTDFRNHQYFELDLSQEAGKSVIITGENGVGKTNILEAISLLVPGKGLRGAKIAELDRITTQQPTSWTIFAEISTSQGRATIGTGRDPAKSTDKRIVKINGETVRGHSELADYFAVCYLTPQMDQTFADGTASRRAYLDRITGAFYPEHTKHLAIYEHAKSERKKLLIMPNTDYSWIAVLERRMAEQAVAIAAARRETIDHLNSTFIDRSSPFPKAILSAKGVVEGMLVDMSALQAEEACQEKLVESRPLDRETRRTNIGTHRSDFIVYHSEKNMPAELCSTGEQKALLLAITIASAYARREWTGAVPVLLLDEVVAHLDEEKRRDLYNELTELSAQSWLTGTDPYLFRDFGEMGYFLVL